MKELALFERQLAQSPIEPMNIGCGGNRFWIKRDDLLPFSFGGNKVRKAAQFYREIKKSGADVVMTYGSYSSNHCRIIANMAAAMGLRCHIISPEEGRELLFNTRMVERFGAVVETCPVSEVALTIEKRKESFLREGVKPYFIAGGGHGNPGTQGYVDAYWEICSQEENMELLFDYIFHASGTGTTQAGLVCGQLLEGNPKRRIVGISIAREKERGRKVVRESIQDYLGEKYAALFKEDALIFEDAFRCGGYGLYNDEILDVIDSVMLNEGIPMDATYVGKAFWGMLKYIEENDVMDKEILFLHTGGTPLFFDNFRLERTGLKNESFDFKLRNEE